MTAQPDQTARNPVILIPARLASTRLPNKPLAEIAGEPMIVHVWRRAREADLGPVYVACADRAIAEVIEAVGGNAVMTDADLPSGSDRIFAALQKVDPEGSFDAVINIQGDSPTLDKTMPRIAIAALDDPAVDIATIACPITDDAERGDPNVVKAVVSAAPGAASGRALYFTRAEAPGGEGPLYHHEGLYVYRRAALERFVALPQSPLEIRERLEQLRALEDGMHIEVVFVDSLPLGVNTPAELELARAALGIT
ncbi:MAG: 3-deoxy-manno-octulosonate cytidylyltransferase [Alphaproteobacteria bacterium]|jgi:3-deoxy-manno-octulosonate cytidylyltransferase (CMP-KDO synthetase)